MNKQQEIEKYLIKKGIFDLDAYIRQSEPNKAQKAKNWNTAIGLQKVDGLMTSEYLINSAQQNIEGYISIHVVKEGIENYYKEHPAKNDTNRTEEADKVSARIAEILSEQTFSFSPLEYLNIHKRLFLGLYKDAGKIRHYNITKNEWVLNGDSVLYANADLLKATLDYDFEQEKKFNYQGLNPQEIIAHIAQFVSFLWQIHIFGEGNTRTTAIFLIKYLYKLGFKDINTSLFAENSWYFRNALVRANYENLSQAVYKTEKYLLRFLFNLVFKENHELKNREMHIQFSQTTQASSEKIGINSETTKEKSPHIIKSSETTKEKSKNIRQSSEMNQEKTKKVTEKTKKVKKSAEKVKKSAEIMKESAEKVKKSAEKVKKSSEIMKENTEIMKESSEIMKENTEIIRKKINKSSEEILNLIKHKPKITTKEIAAAIQLSHRAIEKNISKLKFNGRLERIGADRGGYWKIIN